MSFKLGKFPATDAENASHWMAICRTARLAGNSNEDCSVSHGAVLSATC